MLGGGICSTLCSIYGCKVKRHFSLERLLSVRKNVEESDARMMERDKVMDEPVALRLTQLNPAPPPTATDTDIPKYTRSSSLSFREPLAGRFLPFVWQILLLLLHNLSPFTLESPLSLCLNPHLLGDNTLNTTTQPMSLLTSHPSFILR